MTEVIELRQGDAKPKRSKSEVMNDWILTSCAKWREARALQEVSWAKYDVATLCGTASSRGIELDFRPLERMRDLEQNIARFEPENIRQACELLRVARTITAKAIDEPEHTFASGPVLEILEHVIDALQWRPDVPIGPKKQDRVAD